jgi:hypothetical protein
LTKSAPILNKAFLDAYLPPLYDSLRLKLLTSSESLLRPFKRERLDTLFQTLFGGLLSRLLPYHLRDLERNALMLDLGVHFLRSLNFLEKKIDGAKMIAEVAKNVNIMNYASSAMRNQAESVSVKEFTEKVIQKIREGQVLY